MLSHLINKSCDRGTEEQWWVFTFQLTVKPFLHYPHTIQIILRPLHGVTSMTAQLHCTESVRGGVERQLWNKGVWKLLEAEVSAVSQHRRCVEFCCRKTTMGELLRIRWNRKNTILEIRRTPLPSPPRTPALTPCHGMGKRYPVTNMLRVWFCI